MSQQPHWQQQPYNPYMQPPMPPQPPKRRVRKSGCGIPVLLAFAIGVMVIVSNDYDYNTSTTPSSRPATTKAVTPARLTAEQAAARLADATGMTDLGDPEDNTGSCANADGADAKWNCKQLITTDTVSVYEFGTPAIARHWTDAMKGVGNDWRPVGRFALAWQARDQHLTSEQRRTELVTALRRIAD